jgi:ATP/maltotriose-dependent transcriptional regulator MalT/DNA-binding SARP family transcriptional activator
VNRRRSADKAVPQLNQVATIRRPRLEARLDDALHYRLTSVVGGAGSGKTTLLAQWAAEHDVAWHTLVPRESLTTLSRAIVDQLRLHVAGGADELAMVIESAGGPDRGGGAERADALAAAISDHLVTSLTHDLVLVVDDVNELDPAGDAAALLAGLARHAPPQFHLVLASNRPLPFSTTRLVLEGHAMEIEAQDLAFTVEEVVALLAVGVDDPSLDVARDVVARTGGWSLATAFAVRALGTVDGATVAMLSPERERHLYRYLGDVIANAEGIEMLHALRVWAELPWGTPELAQHLGFTGVAAELAEPGLRSIYMAPASGEPGAMSVSPLVADFVRRQHALTPDERADLNRRAAPWYARRGKLSAALECFIESADDDALASMLANNGAALLAAGFARRIIDALGHLASSDRPPALLVLEAEARQTVGDWEGAAACYEKVIPPTGPIPAGVAWRFGLLHHMRGDVEQAFAVYQRGEVSGGNPADEAALLGWRASAHWLRGERDEAESLAETAIERARVANDSRALATSHTVLAMVAALDGDRAANDAHYLRALEHAERARDVAQTIRIRTNRGSQHTEEGAYEQAMDELDIALRLADLAGFELWRALARSNRGEVLMAQGRLDEATVDLEQARDIFRRMGSRFESYPLANLGEVYAARGDSALAQAAFEGAIGLAEEPLDQQGLVPALAGLARVLAEDEPERAAALAARAASVEPVLGHVKALLAVGCVALAQGDKEEAAAVASRVAEVARARRDRPGIAESLELMAAVETTPERRDGLLEQARSIWLELGAPLGVARVDLARAEAATGPDAAELAEGAALAMEQAGARRAARRARRIASALRAGDEPELSIQVLGGFVVSRRGVPVPPSAWQSRVARDLLRMLVVNRGRSLAREVLVERLWPDEDPVKVANRLSVALSTIRGVLDPDKAHPPDHVLLADRESVAIDMRRVAVDLEHFLAEAGRGQALIEQGRRSQGMAMLRRAEARYVGDLLEDQPYAEWASGPREATRTTYLSIAATLAAADAAVGEHEAAARQYLRMLERDPYHEPAHLGVVAALSSAGHHGSARRLYRNYVARMGELDIEPAAYPGG